MSEVRHIRFDGHRLAYRVAGEGPALVVLHLYRRRDVIQLRQLSDRWQVFEVAPLGYGFSDRVPRYAGEALADQVLAVLDHHGADRFVVWGHSAGGAMAACIARGTPRTAGMVCGAYSPFGLPTAASVRQMDRRLPPDSAARTLWSWVKQFDWDDELRTMHCPRLLFWGSEDRQMAKSLRLAQQRLTLQDVDFIEYAGVGHEVGGDDDLQADLVIPDVVAWTARRVGSAW
jgi:pimeloyl-ACP methyl ester carboxylesterase